MNEYKLFGQRIGLIGILNILVSLSGIILLPILTKNLPIEDYGTWVQIIVTVGLIPSLAMLGLSGSIVRFLAAERDKRKVQDGLYSVIVVILFTSIIASSLLFLFSHPLAECLFGGKSDLIRILALIIPVECMNQVCLNYFRAFQQIKKYSLFVFLQTYGMVALVAYAVFSGYGISGAVLAILISKIIVLLIMSSLIISDIGIKIPVFSHLKEYLHFGLPIVPGTLSNWIVDSSDKYLIAYMLGMAFVGYYAPGYSLGIIVYTFAAPLSFLLFPTLSKIYDEGKVEKVRTYLKYCLKYFLMFAIPSAFGLSLLSKQILIVLATPEIATNGYLVTPFIAVTMIFHGAYRIIVQVIVLVKKTKIIGTVWILAAVINFGLNLVFIPYFGIVGAAVTTLIAYLFAFAFTLYHSCKYFKFDFDLNFILKSIFASVVMSLVIIKWSPVKTLDILIVIGVCAVVYALILLLLGGAKKDEITFFRELSKI